MSGTTMGERHDYVGLEWVKGEIAETLKQARQSLEDYAENPQDTSHLTFCLTYIHQVYGTLQMVEFFGAALLAEEMEELLQALLEERVASRNEALEVMMQAILQLPLYLDRIQTARRDLPMVILPLLNDLRAARGEKLLSETSLFNPVQQVQAQPLSAERIDRLNAQDLLELLRKLRQLQQLSLVGLHRGQEVEKNLANLARVYAGLVRLSQHAPLQPLWEAALGLVEGLANRSLELSASVRNLLRQLDAQLRKLVTKQAAGLNQAPPADLLKNLLFYVAKAHPNSPRLQALHERYGLADALLSDLLLNEERAHMAGPDRGAMHSVVTALCEELVRIKEQLDVFVRSDRSNIEAPLGLKQPLKQIADTLAVLGFAQPRKIILDQNDILHSIERGEAAASDAVLMDIAGALLYVEATLTGIAGSREPGSHEQMLMPTTDVTQIHRVVFKEARTGLEQAKDGIIAFIASQWKHEHLQPVPQLLNQVRGGLVIIPLERAANLVASCGDYVQKELLEQQKIPSWQELDTLADAITGVEYYLERLYDDHETEGQAILRAAEDSLASLGYPSLASQQEEQVASTEAQTADMDTEPPIELEPEIQAAEPYSSCDWSLLAADEPVEENEPEVAVADLMELPEVELPASAETKEVPAASEPAQSLQQVMAAPGVGLNPPSTQAFPFTLLPPGSDEEMPDEELYEIFVEEAGEVQETIAENYPRWRADLQDQEALTELRRAFHTLKGSGRMVKALVLGELAWSIENLLNRIIEHTVEVSQPVFSVIEQVTSLMPELVVEFAEKRQRQRDCVDRLANIAHALARNLPLTGLDFPAEEASEEPEQLEQSVIEPPATPATEAEEQATSDQPVDEVDGDISLDLPAVAAIEAAGLEPGLIEIFISEALLHLEVLGEFNRACAEFTPQTVSDELQRSMHTLKGSAHMSGVEPVAVIVTALERLIKEYRAHLLLIDVTEAPLLLQAEQLMRAGVEQIQSTPLAALPGSEALVQQLQQLLQDRLDIASAEYNQEQGASKDPLLITRLMAEDLHLLLAMDEQIATWRMAVTEPQVPAELLEELSALQEAAHMAEVSALTAVLQPLLRIYIALDNGWLQSGEPLYQCLEQAHEAVVNMLDEVAAGLKVIQQPALVDMLLELLKLEQIPAQAELATAEVVTAQSDVLEAAKAEDDFDEEMVAIFLEEAMDLLDNANASLEQWLQDTGDSTLMAALMRDLHTLKGGAHMAAVQPVRDLAHELELVYEGLLDGRLQAGDVPAQLLRQGQEQLAVQLEQLQAGQPLTVPQELIQRLHQLRNGVRQDKLPVQPETEVVPEAETGKPELPPAAITPQSAAEETESGNAVPVDFDRDPELVEIFLEEGFEIIERLATSSYQWLQQPDNLLHVETLQRDLHTLKGGARMAEISEIGDLAHELESLYEDVCAGKLHSSDQVTRLVHACHDQLESMLEQVRDYQPLLAAGKLVEQIRQIRENPEADLPVIAVQESVEQPIESEPAETAAAVTPPASKTQPEQLAQTEIETEKEKVRLSRSSLEQTDSQPALQPDEILAQALPFVRKAREQASQQSGERVSQEQIRVPAQLLEQLVNLAGETSIFRARVEQQVSDFGYTLGEMEATLARVRDQLRRLDTETQAQIISRHQVELGQDGYEDFDPLEMDQYSQLQQLSRSLFESASDLLDLKETLAAKAKDAETLLLQQSRVNTELQEGLMRTRMVPFERTLPRLRRVVRQVADELGKTVSLHVTNAEGEVDRAVLERMVAPMEHMLRNAISHGIESSEQREAAGKPAAGRINMELGRSGADILLVISDDGAGISLDVVREKALERGLIAENANLTDQEIMQFILKAGLSTAHKVTQVSGRGVGMDVVASEIKQLGGSISIESEAGQGTRFVIRLPFTVSVNRALMVETGEDLYAIPLNVIEGIVRVSPYELEVLYEQARADGTPAHFEYAGQNYELRYIGELLANGQLPKLIGQPLPLPVILVRSQEHAVAVQVDALAGSREIVVKGLGPQFAAVQGIAGATILGDGRVVVILDLMATIRNLYARGAQLQLAGQEQQEQAIKQLQVMIVDDSVTVRKVTSRLLERHAMRVMTAKDGMDAITQLQEHKPDIMLLDIEMPRMDGFEVANLVRHDEQLKDLPIIMITSRTGEKHRERAMAIGVNEYLGKPYQEEELLEKIAALTS